MEHTKHIFRALSIPVLAAIAFVFVRHFAVPPSYGVEGAYRFENVAEQMAKPPVHGDRDACAACHAQQKTTHAGGKHAGVSCETCHAPLAVHAQGAEKIAAMPVDRSPRLCGWCHEALEARPSGFPQVVAEEHAPGGVCVDCHPSHDPGM